MAVQARGGLIFFSLAAIFCCAGVANSEGDNQLTQITECVCPGHDVIFTCTIVGGGNTIWNGSAFNCPSGSDSSNNKIVLRHSGFGMQGNSIGMCNLGAIVGQGISVEDTHYTSQLSVRVNSNIVGKEVSCFYDDLTRELLIGNITIQFTSGADVPLPHNISLIDASPTKLIFEWNPVTHDCSALHYNIVTSVDCGNCPTIANSTNATCSIQPLQPDDVRSCSFSVQAVLCNSIPGQLNNASFMLKVPDAPKISIIPTYSQQNDSLLNITISFPDTSSSPFSGSFETVGSLTSYYVAYMNSSTYTCDSEMITPASFICQDGVCSQEFDVTSTSCYPVSQIIVTVVAANVLGNGSASNSITIGNTNNFVRIMYDKGTTSIFCTFLNQQDTTAKACSIEYVQCEPNLISIPKQVNATKTIAHNTLQIILTFDDSDEVIYCYDVEASNSSYTVHVKGTLNRGRSSRLGAIIGGTIVIILIVITTVAVFMVSIACIVHRRQRVKKTFQNDIELTADDAVNSIEKLDLVDAKRFKLYHVNKKCQLITFMAEHRLPYRIGSVFYEFSRKEEEIAKDKDIIFMDKTFSKRKFTSDHESVRKIIGAQDPATGLKTKKPNIPGYIVFVQSKGIGRRPLLKGTKILHEINPSTEDIDSKSNDSKELIRVRDGRFEVFKVDKPCMLYKFIKAQGKRFEPGCAFFEFANEFEDIDTNKEVILMKKNSENLELYTGREALRRIDAPGANIPKPDLPDYNVFVQSRHFGARHLNPGTLILYEEPVNSEDSWKHISDRCFIMLEVKQPSSLDSFIKECDPKFKTECCFFQFTYHVEAIDETQEIIMMNKKSGKLFTGPEVRRKIVTPGTESQVRNPNLEDYLVFIQNAGGGSRSLESGTLLLYDTR